MHISTFTDLLNYSTLKINTDSGCGTGFLFNFTFVKGKKEVLFLVTNKHVVKDSLSGTITFHLQSQDEKQKFHEAPLTGNLWKWIEHPDKNVDLCVLPLDPIIKQLQQQNIAPVFRVVSENEIISEEGLNLLTPVSDILMVGYPIGLIDDHNNLPIFRRGITATHPALSFQGNPHFLIDAACWPGSSGSPVFTQEPALRNGAFYIGAGNPCANKLLGILWGGPLHTADGQIIVKNIPIQQTPILKTNILINLGYVIHAKELLQIKTEIAKKL